MANIQKQMHDVNASLESNAFDLSERHLFSAKVGQCLPVYNKQVVPGDYFEIDPVAFLRTQRVNTASYARMRQHIDFFFVPYCQLFHQFGQMKYQRQDPVSSSNPNFSNGAPKNSPFISLNALYRNILCIDANNPAGTDTNTVVSSSKDEFGYFEVCNRARLADLLGYGSLRSVISKHYDVNNKIDGVQTPKSVDGVYTDKHVNLWPWLAYQKIWSDFYRNPWYDLLTDSADFNLDDMPCDTYANSDVSIARVVHMGGTPQSSYRDPQLNGIFKLRYRQWKRDYFTGLFPDRQFGDVSMIVGSSPTSFTSSATLYNSSNASLVKDGDNYILNGSGAGGMSPVTLTSGISALDMRRAELLQIWKEKTLRAGFHTDAQQMAHFGVRSEYMADDHVKHLGGVSELISINEVVSTSLNKTGLSSAAADGLGELGGKGTSLNQGQKIRFKAKDDGIIMAIFSILPETDYNSFGLAADHQRIDPFDYFTPAFQNLGFEAVTRSQLDVIDVSSNHPMTEVLGYAPPYYDMKQGVDKVHGEFINNTNGVSPLGNFWANYTRRGGSLQAFACGRRDATELAATLSFFYVNPNVVDSVFAFNADSFEDSDEFFVNMYLDIKAVRPMSVLGLPNF